VKKRPEHIPEEFIEISLPVSREFAGWRADRFVALRIPRLSRTRVQRILERFAFDDGGRPFKASRALRDGERITIFKPPPDEPAVPREFGVAYEDEWFLAVDKPPGLPVHPTARYLHNTLTGLLDERYGPGRRPVLVHRLDSETSGLVLCARTPEAERAAKRLFADREVAKTYLALVRGTPDPPSGRIEAAIGPDRESVIRIKMACRDPDGLPALTEFRTLETRGAISLVEARPRTGRQHQIRVHLAHIGHPVVGDKLYGPDENLFLEYVEHGPSADLSRRAGHRRQALHAARLELAHPFTGAPLVIEAPLPRDLADLLSGPEGGRGRTSDL
jgi:23S rRNA pseudouridine1911/1915/1917 synthase